MQGAKIDFLTKYNSLITLAIKGSVDFPDCLCDFLVNQHDLNAVVLFKVNEDKHLVLIGKSAAAKKSYLKNSFYECNFCKQINSNASEISFSILGDCEIQTTDFVMYEGCLYIKPSEKEKLILKIAKKTPLTQSDKDNLISLGESLSNLFKIWYRNEGNIGISVSKILTDIAHELRTPTNSIMGFASLLNEDNLTPSQSEYVSTLKENAYSLLSLINDLIDLAKIESAVTKEILTSVNIKNYIEEITKIFKDKPEASGIEFLMNFDKDLPGSLRLDVQKLRFIIVNIITYSSRLTEKGKISISVSLPNPNKLNFKITDSSTGLSSVQIKEIFKPFSLSELGNVRIGHSTGLGLTLAKKYIELLNGSIDVSSSLGKGTIYQFSIGIEPVSMIEAQISALPKPVKKNRVLVVEDDYASSKLLSNYLNKWGYDPLIVNSAEQTLKLIEKENFLAILLDIVLPDANGFELLKKIRENKNTKRTPVIVCSVEAEQQKAFLMGAVEYFVKPIQYKFLVEVLLSYKLKRDSNILIVDDDVPTLNLIREAVEQAGFNAIAESRSAKVIDMIENMNLDLAIIDLDMPEVNGYDLIKQIKTKPNFSKLPIVIYTGKENYKEDLKKIDGLFEELLEKNSSNIEDLADTITNMINRFDEPVHPESIPAEKEVVKILLVEDYKHSQIIVTRLLKKNNFEYIMVVENGAEALEEVKKQKFDLILMDMQMPVMNGFEATERIRHLPEYRDTPIIALTAFAMKGDREKCLEAGATDYIPKPIDSHEFIEKVKHYTEIKVANPAT